MHEIAIYINEKPDLDEDKTVWFTNRFYRPNVPLIRLPHNYSSVLIRSLVYDGILDKKWFINYISLVRDFDEINLDIVASIAPYPYYDIIEYISGYFFGTTRGSCYPVIDLIPSTSVIPVLATILMERSGEFNNVVIDSADLFSREEFLLLKEVCDDFDINLYLIYSDLPRFSIPYANRLVFGYSILNYYFMDMLKMPKELQVAISRNTPMPYIVSNGIVSRNMCIPRYTFMHRKRKINFLREAFGDKSDIAFNLLKDIIEGGLVSEKAFLDYISSSTNEYYEVFSKLLKYDFVTRKISSVGTNLMITNKGLEAYFRYRGDTIEH